MAFALWFLELFFFFFALNFDVMGFYFTFCLFSLRSHSLFDLLQFQFYSPCVKAISKLPGQQSVCLASNLKLRMAAATLMKQERFVQD